MIFARIFTLTFLVSVDARLRQICAYASSGEPSNSSMRMDSTRLYRLSGFVDAEDLPASAFLHLAGTTPDCRLPRCRRTSGNGVVGSGRRYHSANYILIDQSLTCDLVAGVGFGIITVTVPIAG